MSPTLLSPHTLLLTQWQRQNTCRRWTLRRLTLWQWRCTLSRPIFWIGSEPTSSFGSALSLPLRRIKVACCVASRKRFSEVVASATRLLNTNRNSQNNHAMTMQSGVYCRHHEAARKMVAKSLTIGLQSTEAVSINIAGQLGKLRAASPEAAKTLPPSETSPSIVASCPASVRRPSPVGQSTNRLVPARHDEPVAGRERKDGADSTRKSLRATAQAPCCECAVTSDRGSAAGGDLAATRSERGLSSRDAR
jgi:hypothetical protein